MRMVAPICSVPTDILRIILALVVVGDPNNRRSILHISQISQILRLVVLDTSELFTHADWNPWHPELIRTWNARSKWRPLSITLNRHTYGAFYDDSHGSRLNVESMEKFNALEQVLFAALTRCHSLSLTFETGGISKRKPIFPVHALADKCPKLVNLSIACHSHSVLYLDLDGFPTVQSLHLDSVQPLFKREMPHLDTLTCGFYDLDSYRRVTHFLPKLESLILRQFGRADLLCASGVLELDALKRLEIGQANPDEAVALAILFQHHLSLPSIQHLTLSGVVISEKYGYIFWPALAKAAPSIQCITLKREQMGYWPLDVSFKNLALNPGELPLLSELRLLGRDVRHLLRPMLDLVSSRVASITRLTLPPREEFDTHELRLWDSLHQLAGHFMVSAQSSF
ncbi:hypothetical protein DL93DRAFT_2164831 [Clavulina sp. PMI_390]|nr:hypothetical protein DL93DRAFT_2164831 [Clavulina sp. PMI_390]